MPKECFGVYLFLAWLGNLYRIIENMRNELYSVIFY
jgi:hypothetical protein